MKKLIFTLAGISLSSLLFAQFGNPVSHGNVYMEPSAKKYVRTGSFNKSSISAWYTPLEFIKPTMGSILEPNRSVFFSTNDSLFKTIYVDQSGSPTNSNFYNDQLGFGMVLDPKDADVGNSSTAVQLTKNNPYTVDSIGFKYIYVRNVDQDNGGNTIVDTLFIAYYKGSSQITTGSLNVYNVTNKYATTSWNGLKRMPVSYSDIDTILLDGFTLEPTTTSNNEQSFGSSYVTIPAPAGIDVAANSLVGFSITFKSGIPPVVGSDTAIIIYQLDPSTDPLPANARRANYFGSLQCFDNRADNNGTGTSWNNPTYYNSSLFQISQTGYNQSTSFKTKYVPGVGFGSNRFADAYTQFQDGTDAPLSGFFITCTNVGLDDIKNDVFVMSNVYPNPAKSSDMATLAFTLKQAGNVNVSVINMVGQEVKSVLNKKYNAGFVTESIDLSGLKPGIYLLNMNVNGSSSSQKLTIVE